MSYSHDKELMNLIMRNAILGEKNKTGDTDEQEEFCQKLTEITREVYLNLYDRLPTKDVQL